MIRHDDMRTVTDYEILSAKSVLMNIFNLLQQGRRTNNHTITNYTFLVIIKNTRRDQTKLVLLTVDENGMTGIVTALITGHHICALREIIRDFTFTFVPPLGSHNDYC
ncbi:hypothetical protein D3C78_1492890 [compost metagenome]